MQYLLLIYTEERPLDPDRDPMGEMQPWIDYTSWLTEKGWLLGGDALTPTADATSVRVRDGERLVTDGPFSETKEALGGYYLIEVEHLDDAIEAAARCPGAAFGTLEVRPIAPMPEMPELHP
jgi:hypothetical protein